MAFQFVSKIDATDVDAAMLAASTFNETSDTTTVKIDGQEVWVSDKGPEHSLSAFWRLLREFSGEAEYQHMP